MSLSCEAPRPGAGRTGAWTPELEGLRGAAALLVVLFHMPAWNAAAHGMPLIRNGYLMVQLFFVLSGFVIYRAYGERITDGRALARFQFLRLARLYPVHALFLAAFLAIECLKYVAEQRYGLAASGGAAFSDNDGAAFLQQLLLAQSIAPLGDALTFNYPAWSISAELAAYTLFGVMALTLGRGKILAMGAMAAAALVLLAFGGELALEGLVTCLAGFGLGCLLAFAADRAPLRLPSWSPAFWLLVLAAYLCVKEPDAADLWIFPLAAALVFSVVCAEDGAVRRALRGRWMMGLGAISYAVYMAHASVLWLASQAVRFVLDAPEAMVDGRMTPQLGGPAAFAAYAAALAAVLALAAAVHVLVERPCREASRRLVRRRQADAAPA